MSKYLVVVGSRHKPWIAQQIYHLDAAGNRDAVESKTWRGPAVGFQKLTIFCLSKMDHWNVGEPEDVSSPDSVWVVDDWNVLSAGSLCSDEHGLDRKDRYRDVVIKLNKEFKRRGKIDCFSTVEAFSLTQNVFKCQEVISEGCQLCVSDPETCVVSTLCTVSVSTPA